MASTTPTTETDASLALAAIVQDGFSSLKRRMRDAGGTSEVTPSQGSALRRIYLLGPCTVSELAAAEGVRPQSMGATVASLEAIGYVVGAPDPSDGRRTILALSPRVLEEFFANQTAWQGWLVSAIRSTLSAEEQRELARGFTVLAKLLNSYKKEHR